jgi:hypothetical protein
MSRTVNANKVKRPQPRVIVFTLLWVVLFMAALLVIGFGGHI